VTIESDKNKPFASTFLGSATFLTSAIAGLTTGVGGWTDTVIVTQSKNQIMN
jgi:hypothetical protein